MIIQIIQNVLIPTEQGYATVDVEIAADQIAAIVPAQSSARTDTTAEVIDGRNKLLLPGFVNAHTHSPEIWQRGAIPPLPLELWLSQLYGFALLDPEQIYLSALVTAVETLLSGGTTLVDHLILIPGRETETIAAAVRAYREVGIRAFIGPLIHDQELQAGVPAGEQSGQPQPLDDNTQKNLELIQNTVAEFHCPPAGIHIMVAPTGLQLCSDQLFEGCIELSDRYQLCRHTHLLETKAQQILAQENYGCSAVAHLKHLGFLSPRTSLAHCVWLDDADVALLAETGSTVVHNPLSNLRLGSGIAPILKYRRAGVNVTFGCDGSASNDAQDLLETIKLGTILHNTTHLDYRQWLTPYEAIQMASLGGAKGLDLSTQTGTLAVGQKADLVLYDLTNLSLLPRTDPVGLLVLGRPCQAIHRVWVNGKQIVTKGQVTTVNIDMLKQELFNRSNWGNDRYTTSLGAMETQYRSVMGLAT